MAPHLSPLAVIMQCQVCHRAVAVANSLASPLIVAPNDLSEIHEATVAPVTPPASYHSSPIDMVDLTPVSSPLEERSSSPYVVPHMAPHLSPLAVIMQCQVCHRAVAVANSLASPLIVAPNDLSEIHEATVAPVTPPASYHSSPIDMVDLTPVSSPLEERSSSPYVVPHMAPHLSPLPHLSPDRMVPRVAHMAALPVFNNDEPMGSPTPSSFESDSPEPYVTGRFDPDPASPVSVGPMLVMPSDAPYAPVHKFRDEGCVLYYPQGAALPVLITAERLGVTLPPGFCPVFPGARACAGACTTTGWEVV
eukprot:TRINITY_DN2539_c0_g1_i2.p1 TRINITY_DN2539_c0_g1~~TRINITY_DN2539_c0_g1_i2.p1  ORF type:complete len:307 (+),score=23.07 TRINITY_DN2539_c0_g1_i2:1-921(+)